MHAALHKLKILPNQWMSLSREEQAFITASLVIYGEKIEKEQKAIKSKTGR